MVDCEHKEFDYDSFEDMYRCRKCENFFYPEEIGKEPNPEAGYKKLNIA